jgi:hypothetical protein
MGRKGPANVKLGKGNLVKSPAPLMTKKGMKKGR